ncbi:tRNA (adenine(37)-N6)-methyltransferase isoform X2 [Telopea speciosissima]|nr:tRNA (adenine(37)-N6)-methyltransferase isoform X2 [Telopea speciosissima]XP_043719993.1 tRNA (adenine(37)-N6)-methyltransferase isoform X2 [Telopea speciosissima]XP_043719994.1 tRNA (adenine(37)-N6)-methyltransferase isoform X2 [Telopea speciosissima]
MTPIAVVQSCFTTRNGTPRQPLLVPLARACLILDSSRVPPAALEGLGEYSHCWILYVFHLNTDLEKLWKQPSKSKFKAKVRVPRLKGCKMGVFATRSPHRLCPIGLTVAKVEAVRGRMVLLSGVDLVDGTPVLDVKPYLPYCDSIPGATVPKWVMEDNLLAVASINFSQEFSSTLANFWATTEKTSLYASPDEIQSLIKQVLSWDIRSVSQRNRPHNVLWKMENCSVGDISSDLEGDEVSSNEGGQFLSSDITYHLMLEGIDISYRIDVDRNVIVEKASLSPEVHNGIRNRCNYMMWRDGNG